MAQITLNSTGVASNGTLALQSNGTTTAVTIDTSQNVGIGTASPTQKFTAVNNSGTYGTAYQPIIQIGNTSSGGTVGNPTGLGAIVWSTDGTATPVASIEAVRENPGSGAASALYFRTGSSGGGTTRAVITSGGYFVVGDSTATSALNGARSASNVPLLAGFSTATSGYTDAVVLAEFRNYSPNNTTARFLYCGDNVAARMVIYSNGNVQNTNNSYGGFSDIKLKENIVDATPKLEKLNQVRVVNYNMIGDEQKQIGVIAQELEQIFPSMVDESPDYEEVTTTDEDGNETTERVATGTTTKSVKYSVFVPMLIKALQEQQAIITQLQADVAALKGTA